MKVLHLVSSDEGGAGRAAYRISTAQNLCGVDSKLLVKNKHRDLINVEGFEKNKIDKIFTRIISEIDNLPLLKYKNREKQIFSCGLIGNNILKNKALLNSDIINLHWINDGYISIKTINKILKLGKPVVWTFHDMWPFTGGCHYSGVCTKYIQGCFKCPVLNCDKNKDLSRYIFNKKYKNFLSENISVSTCSSWLGECAKKSKLFRKSKVNVIGNSIDTNLFKNIEKKVARNILNISPNKKLILFVAPSLEENLANTVMESLSCGTPVLAFNIGGMPDMIEHKVNGYLAAEKSSQDLANGLKWILNDNKRYNWLRENARKKILQNYTYEIIGSKYKKLYEEILYNNH